MSGQLIARRALALAAFVTVVLGGFAAAATGIAATPLPRATASATAGVTKTATTTPSDTDVDPADEPTDDGSDPTPDQTGTWLAIGGALGLSVLAGLVVALRRR
ncbi:hypothetical protein [Micropruina sonneratiae]|uniref:hypothetical protein n=1 Tax=Micropruina sonneratiae TaxID=2986940 RepID=UPI002227A02C|nr:hypothetical protein [Micropruina sp. KQZ13P-5]MCW3158911.1 hypothetical protein [Micropruina sp. KQZ13P-5]